MKYIFQSTRHWLWNQQWDAQDAGSIWKTQPFLRSGEIEILTLLALLCQSTPKAIPIIPRSLYNPFDIFLKLKSQLTPNHCTFFIQQRTQWAFHPNQLFRLSSSAYWYSRYSCRNIRIRIEHTKFIALKLCATNFSLQFYWIRNRRRKYSYAQWTRMKHILVNDPAYLTKKKRMLHSSSTPVPSSTLFSVCKRPI